MRFILPLGLGVSFAACVISASALFGAGCSAGVASLSGEGGATDGSPDDAASSDGSSDGAPSSCKLMGTAYDKTCKTVADCAALRRGCYCGAQPIIGIATSALAAAQACETQAASMCALGCANSPGGVAEDGKNNADGGTIQVMCDVGQCHTVLR